MRLKTVGPRVPAYDVDNIRLFMLHPAPWPAYIPGKDAVITRRNVLGFSGAAPGGSVFYFLGWGSSSAARIGASAWRADGRKMFGRS